MGIIILLIVIGALVYGLTKKPKGPARHDVKEPPVDRGQ